MTPLRQRLIDEIQLRGFSPNTQNSYVHWVITLAQFYHRSPDQLGDAEIKGYLLHLLRVRKLAAGSLIVAVNAFRFFFANVLHRPTQAIEEALPRMKKPVRRPRVYSVAELERLFGYPGLNRKHRAIFLTTYAAGLRVSEVCHLRIVDLQSDRNQIRIVQSKSQKDRYTIFSLRLQFFQSRFRPVDGMHNPRVRKHKHILEHPVHPLPRMSLRLSTAPRQPLAPHFLRRRAHLLQTPPIAGNTVIGIVPVEFAHQNLELVEHAVMAVGSTPVPDRPQCAPQSLGRRFATNDPIAFPRSAPVMVWR